MWAGIIHIAVKMMNLAIILLIDKNIVVNLCFITTDKYGILPLHIICDRLQENRAQRGNLRKKFFALTELSASSY